MHLYVFLSSFRWTTRIILPLKTGSSMSYNMLGKFQDVKPSLLLFLNRLKCIIIEDKVNKNSYYSEVLSIREEI
jgi:hypothetical protein